MISTVAQEAMGPAPFIWPVHELLEDRLAGDEQQGSEIIAIGEQDKPLIIEICLKSPANSLGASRLLNALHSARYAPVLSLAG